MSYRDFGDECGCLACTTIGGNVAANLGGETGRKRMSQLGAGEGFGQGHKGFLSYLRRTIGKLVTLIRRVSR